jgi:NAD(P)-dependent dehydrogenase (short-subunit alcohol dehydrogenase family)
MNPEDESKGLILSKKRMNSKTVLITGAQGGLGSALTQDFMKNGWTVIATDLDNKIPKDELPDNRLIRIAMDVSSDESVGIVAGQLKQNRQQLDIIINNAGIDRYFPLCETPVAKFKEIFEVNVFGCYRVNQAFLPVLKKPGGRIINISSEAVKINVPFMTYPVSKQTLESYSRTLRQELRFLGIDVVLIRPGAINTPFLENVKKIKNPVSDSLLQVPFEKFAEQAYREIGKTIDPFKAAKFILKIAQAKKIKFIYKINNSMLLSIASMLPFWVIERMVYRRLK